MELLKQRILQEGFSLPGNVLKVDSFLNQQIDPELSLKMGEEFVKRFHDCKIDRVLTIEASGIAIGLTTALKLGVPLVFARKRTSILMTESMYSTKVFSYTKKETNTISVLKKFLPAAENVLIIDDFLANGDSALGLAKMVEEAGSKVVGIGIAIEKSFQIGKSKLTEAGYRIESLARIKSLADCKIEFVEE
ncbi:xanthine phosphoribosyltransferase [Propionispira arboris]|uniref:Xanthine phosphoribosyltransferase n=1 Tax=Propionispira arboris TaxID=84035 RepID=A0A1H6YVV5_9FIRM|nr:xanthine phosphoribosyltransferase [Propionispira arboris]SEJ40935.1 xanthine phosphoribosyltransferase [Propionispira arboris]